MTGAGENDRDNAGDGGNPSGDSPSVGAHGGGNRPADAGGGRAVAVASESSALIAMIERAARDPTVDIDKFERLMTMSERVNQQAAYRAFNAAISNAKAQIPPIFKNKTVDFTSQKGRTNYRHEDFAEVARVVDPILGAHGLSYRYRSSQSAGKLTVTCVLSHLDGHSEDTTLEVAEDHSGNKNTIQAIGSSATYLQRYTLKLALGLASSTDDDGKAAGASVGATITEEQAEKIKAALDATDAELPRFCRYWKLEKLTDLPADKFEAAMASIQKAADMRGGRK